MPAQGTALGIGSRVENNNALKGQNRFVVKNLVSPFQGWGDFHSDQIPRALPWAFLFRPLRGGRKAQHQNFQWHLLSAPSEHVTGTVSLRLTSGFLGCGTEAARACRK
jgi:hypothetical protein